MVLWAPKFVIHNIDLKKYFQNYILVNYDKLTLL